MQFNFSFPIQKFEKLEDGRLLIAGVATDETLDSQGDILDYDGTKKAFGTWRGNLREQHDPKKAVGKALEVTFDDSKRAVSVEAFISSGAQDTQAKITEGVLTSFSVGGTAPKKARMEKRDGKQVRRVLDWDMTELSVVDAGANPNAVITLVKGDGATDQLAGEPDAVPAPEPDRFAKALLDAVEAGPVKKDAAPPEPLPAPAPEPEGVPEATAEPAEADAPADAPTSPEATEKVDEIADCSDGKCGKCNKCNKAKEEPEAAAVPEEAKAEKTEGEPETKKHYGGGEEYDIANALLILEHLKALTAAEAAEGTPEAPCMAELNTAISAVKRFIALEAGELIEQDAPVDMAAPADVAGAVGREVSMAVDAAMQKQAEALPAMLKAAVTDALGEIKKADVEQDDQRIEKLASAIGHGLSTANAPVLKAIGDFKAAHDGEAKATREMLEKVAKQPQPTPPARFAHAGGAPPNNDAIIAQLEAAMAATNSPDGQAAIRQQIAIARARIGAGS